MSMREKMTTTIELARTKIWSGLKTSHSTSFDICSALQTWLQMRRIEARLGNLLADLIRHLYAYALPSAYFGEFSWQLEPIKARSFEAPLMLPGI